MYLPNLGSNDLNRLLDEPGPDPSRLFLLWKYLFYAT